MSEQSERATVRVGHTMKDDCDVYVGRGPNGRHMLSDGVKPGDRGWLGNPYTVDKYGREQCIDLFGVAFQEKLNENREFAEAVLELQGKTLGCWCQRLDDDEPACHAQVIARTLDDLPRERAHFYSRGVPR